MQCLRLRQPTRTVSAVLVCCSSEFTGLSELTPLHTTRGRGGGVIKLRLSESKNNEIS